MTEALGIKDMRKRFLVYMGRCSFNWVLWSIVFLLIYFWRCAGSFPGGCLWQFALFEGFGSSQWRFFWIFALPAGFMGLFVGYRELLVEGCTGAIWKAKKEKMGKETNQQ